ncbi:hemerythrin domain-containing protein [Melioribacteraceae bacterium 4301-Me]|uniref:hemerythrin domain-containing protein n=1 Tax=Pyranulibacter aquaticus TaxID=3163344 RepID=UPI00359577B2
MIHKQTCLTAVRNRRDFIKKSGLVLGVTAISSTVFANINFSASKIITSIGGEEEVSPAEDLMREHGVLKRVLLVYQEIIDRINSKLDFPPEIVHDSAAIIRNFIEDYHEKLEEDFLFPRFKKANTLIELVDVLTVQHKIGRKLTDKLLNLFKNNLKTEEDKKLLSNYLNSFIKMYNPHEAREDTVLFPAFKKLVTQNEYDSLGEEFEDKEHELFGEDGFESMVDKVANIEKRLGIYDLSKFTPDSEARE